MKKLTKRKAFNFLRSYFDVLNELEKDKDKLDFLLAVINKQFLDEDPDLKGMAKFGYISQLHAIEKSVKGWKDATGQALTGAYVDPLEGYPPTPSQQEQEKEEGEEQEEEKEKPFNFLNSLIDLGVEKQVAKDYMAIRKKKKGTNTETAFNTLANQIAKTNKSANEIILLCIEKNWMGFNSQWVKDKKEERELHPYEKLYGRTS